MKTSGWGRSAKRAPRSPGQGSASASVTLAAVTAIQTLLMGIYMWLREPFAYREICRNLPFSVLIGLTSVAGSLAWFSAMTLQKAAYVRTLGQVELVLSLLVSYLVFREKSTRYEILGMAMIVAGIVILLLYR
jgi:drug/metabolite transporter (DMT)-like permease